MAKRNPTRSTLINLRRTIVLAGKGHDLLKKKREVLVIEFLKMLQESKADRERLQEVLQAAYKTTAIASAYVGDFELQQASEYVPESSGVGVSVKNVMGVRIPEIESKSSPQANYATLQESLAVSDVADSFDNVKNMVIEVAKREQGLKRLVLEIDKVKRRVNALEYILLPNLTREANYISFRLNEIDRDVFSALKHVKKRLEKAQK